MDFAGYMRELVYMAPEGKNEYPFNLPVVQKLSHIMFSSPVTFLVGENGSGKSTLLEAMAVAYGFNPEGGSRNFNFATSSTHSSLHEHLCLIKGAKRPRDGFFLRAESLYNVASEIERLDAIECSAPKIAEAYGGKSLHAQSHGESFLALMVERFGGEGLYLLDEPEAALSAERQMSLLVRMDELVKQNSQFIIATHSPILLSYPHATIFTVDDGAWRITPYEQTAAYQVTRHFLNDYKRYLAALLEK